MGGGYFHANRFFKMNAMPEMLQIIEFSKPLRFTVYRTEQSHLSITDGGGHSVTRAHSLLI